MSVEAEHIGEHWDLRHFARGTGIYRYTRVYYVSAHSLQVQSLFKALLGLLLCASSPPIRQMSFREVIQTLEGKLALPPTVVQASVAPLGIPLPLLTHVPSHMRLWTVDNSVSLARNLTPVKMLGRRHRDHHHHHRHYHFPVGSLHAATPVVDQRCYVGTAVPERLTFNGSS